VRTGDDAKHSLRKRQTIGDASESVLDAHSFSNPDQIRVDHISLDLEVLFEQRVIRGAVVLRIANPCAKYGNSLILDTMDLTIDRVTLKADGGQDQPAVFGLGERDRILGTPLSIDLRGDTKLVRVEYSTSPNAAALQWLEPRQTAGKNLPFVYTQSQSIYARSWIPLQDSPQVRITYDARIRTPDGLLALMSADDNNDAPRCGSFSFKMMKPIPSYLIALAVGDLAFAPLGRRSGVYAEPTLLPPAAAEFDDIEKMMTVAERLYGPYRWGRYDLLVLPPSFPFGGMENPELTFITPTVLAGDKSLVSVAAHELAHSWSGNLVSNATWRDFWLNEGFTVYVERRILEEVYGAHRATMEATLGMLELQREMATLDERDEIMHVELQDRNPDEGLTEVPYEKGALFLRHVEEILGRRRFDRFLRRYFDHFAFQSITTSQFVAYLHANLLDQEPGLASEIALEEWLYEPGMPLNAPRPKSGAFDDVERNAQLWLEDRISPQSIDEGSWTTHEWLYFLRRLPESLGGQRMQELDQAYHLTNSTNVEIACQWLLMAIRNSFEPAYHRLEEFMTAIGRLKVLNPLYRELVKTTAGRARALGIYEKARSGYHPIAVASIDQILRG
jgi:leukotriene-A4 hydrolase